MDDDVNRADGRPDRAGDAGDRVAEQRGGEHEPAAASSLAAELRQMWQQLDPVPSGLSERVVFSLEVEAFTGIDLDLELELMRLQQTQSTGVGARGDDEVRTVTFGSESMTVMLAISDVEGGHRIDGWVAPGGRRGIEVRTAAGASREECDETGRFALAFVPPGHFQLVLVGDDPGDAQRAVVTPALTL
ncbi:hypothetical protein [Aquipuribacter sp. MA13-6]|uniref:hypothetical protein n=1 Tax=unclassified Aquipuribacter TaxID=2635084 RepID=UPI003EF03945